MWDAVVERLHAERYRPLAIDLPGHGARSGMKAPITFAACVECVLEQAPAEFILCGYSMGGRIALHVALAAPARVRRLVLIGSDPGIDDGRERAVRRAADGLLARELEEGSFELFVERWGAQPLFAGDPPEVREQIRMDQLRNEPHALARALRGLGTGSMPQLWPRLAELAMPVTFLTGDRDEKFVRIGRRVVEHAARAELVTLSGGHRLPLENPAGVASAIARPHASADSAAGAAGAPRR
jgi:2-succinyl-6-hydroxy-2,4-cyclohexadiene-1-carboxylate synthase